VKAISIEALHEAAKSRPDGYLDDVMAYATKQDETHVFLATEDFYLLRDKYSGTSDFPMSGPGAHLHKILGTFGIKFSEGCSCRGRMIQMNKWGVQGCEENIETIVEWLKEEAARRKLPYITAAGRMLVRRAIHNARKEAQRAEATT